MANWKKLDQMTYLGKRYTRVDGKEKVTGKAKYTHDISLPGMLHARILRSPHAHAKINNIDHEDEFQALMEILLPVRNSIKFAEDIRSLTSGKAFWQNEFHSYMEIPSHESDAIINDLRFHKGLSW